MELTQIYKVIDALPREALEQLHRYIQQRHLTTIWEVPSESSRAIEILMSPTHELTAHMSEDEINTIIDEAIAEARF